MRRTVVHRGLTAAAATGTVVATVLATTASATPATGTGTGAGTRPTVVLVHGGFADASTSWEGVVERLQDGGYRVIAPANPLRGLTTDAPYIRSVLAAVEGPVVLAGHSYGGAVITNAAAGNPNVKALVYVAASVPDRGERLSELFGRYPQSELPQAVEEVPFPNPDGTTGTDLYLKPDKFRSAFAADLPRSVTHLMHATQRPMSASFLTDPTLAAAWRDTPSWAVVAGADKAIPPALQRFMYDRAAADTVEVKGASHAVVISHSGTVTDVIEAADHATR
ncbi:alpha/beta hydrolase [Streptomyces sp. NPDC093252]|uniref:alpha/beta fold hydrolase n=1 Tax=Streptomyces sp. NPDC093252 TaxID=3154980 RepID=UPI00341AB37E